MKNTLLTLTVFSLLLFGIIQKANASHYAGTDLYYKCLGGNQYQVTLVFYRDCDGIAEPTSADILLTNGCTGGTTSFNFGKKPNSGSFINGNEITSTCTGVLSTCNGGSAPGLRKWVYEGVITVPTSCTDWKLSYELCCRNNAITTLQAPGSEALYTETTFKSNLCDNAPEFTNNPIAFACVNQPFNYNQGALDSDGDSIAYELDDPLSTSGTPVAFAAGYSKTNPFSTSGGFAMSAVTGAVSFTPNALQVGVFAIKVKQYRNGNLIGYVRRDMEIFVTNCNSNNLPVASGFDGTTNYTADVCVNQSLCADILSNDLDASQNVTLTWNQGITGATFTVGAGNHPTGTFCWTPSGSDVAGNPHVFTVTVKDNACPTNGEQTFSYIVNVIPQPVILFNTSNAVCSSNNGSATAVVSGNNSYLWSNGATYATISGLASGDYTVTVTNSNGCSSSDSVNIGLSSSNITLSGTTADDNGSCNGSIDLSVSGGASPFTYNWSNGSTAEDLSGVCTGTYTVNVADANGCSANSSYTVGLTTGGCKITLSLKSNDEGMCKTGGVINGVTTGVSGSGVVVLYNSSGNVMFQKNFTKTFGFANLQQGTYTVTVTDQQGCTASGTVTVGIGNCGAPVNVHAVNITSASAKVVWNHCGSTKHVVRYKVEGAGNPYNIITVNNINELVLTSLSSNTRYVYSVRSVCGKGKYSLYSLNKKFCTGTCTVPKMEDEVDLTDALNSDFAVSYSVSPNPSADLIHLTGESNKETTAKVVISNLLGKVVLTQDVNLDLNFDLSIEVNSLPQGVYMINISGFESSSVRFIKM